MKQIQSSNSIKTLIYKAFQGNRYRMYATCKYIFFWFFADTASALRDKEETALKL